MAIPLYVDNSSMRAMREHEHMEDLSELSLEQLIEVAQRVSALDHWQKADGVIVFRLSTMTITVHESSAKTFVRGLLRGFQRAAMIDRQAQRKGSERPHGP